MSRTRLYIDEDVHGFVARALRLRGWQALTTQDAGNSGLSDEDQLDFAAREGLAFLTYNVGDFASLHYQYAEAGRAHAGIVLGRQSQRSANLKPLFRLLSSVSASQLANQLVYLSNWVEG